MGIPSGRRVPEQGRGTLRRVRSETGGSERGKDYEGTRSPQRQGDLKRVRSSKEETQRERGQGPREGKGLGKEGTGSESSSEERGLSSLGPGVQLGTDRLRESGMGLCEG